MASKRGRLSQLLSQKRNNEESHADSMNEDESDTEKEAESSNSNDHMRSSKKSRVERQKRIIQFKDIMDHEGSLYFLAMNITIFPSTSILTDYSQSIKDFDKEVYKRIPKLTDKNIGGFISAISNKQSRVKEKISRSIDSFMYYLSWRKMNFIEVSS